MKHITIICIPEDEMRDLSIQSLASVQVNFFGYHYYSSSVQEDEGIICYAPKREGWFVNVHLPTITVKRIQQSSGLSLEITGKIRTTLHFCFNVLCVVLLGVVQIRIVKYCIVSLIDHSTAEFLENGIMLFITLLFDLLFLLPFHIANQKYTEAFSKKYKEELVHSLGH